MRGRRSLFDAGQEHHEALPLQCLKPICKTKADGLHRKDTAQQAHVTHKASSQDNAACEGFFGRLKTEFIYPRDWRDFSREQFIDAVDGYICWYNETRIKKMSLGGRSPIEYRESLGLAT